MVWPHLKWRSASISVTLLVFRCLFFFFFFFLTICCPPLDHLYLVLCLVCVRAPYSRAVLNVRSYKCEVGRGFCFTAVDPCIVYPVRGCVRLLNPLLDGMSTRHFSSIIGRRCCLSLSVISHLRCPLVSEHFLADCVMSCIITIRVSWGTVVASAAVFLPVCLQARFPGFQHDRVSKVFPQSIHTWTAFPLSA